MPLINCEVNLILTWSRDCVITNSTGKAKFGIIKTKIYVPVVALSVPVVALSTQDIAKLLQRLKSGFKRPINWNKYEANIKNFCTK